MVELGIALDRLTGYYDVCGIVDQQRRIYPLGSDTKVLSTVFELISRPVIYKLAVEHGFEAWSQSHKITIPTLLS